MDFNELKALAKQLGGIVVLNGSTPELVILSYHNYRRLAAPVPTFSGVDNVAAVEPDGAEIERLNQEISALKEEIRQREEAELAAGAGEEPGA